MLQTLFALLVSLILANTSLDEVLIAELTEAEDNLVAIETTLE